jgi:hypothetical protein
MRVLGFSHSKHFFPEDGRTTETCSSLSNNKY